MTDLWHKLAVRESTIPFFEIWIWKRIWSRDDVDQKRLFDVLSNENYGDSFHFDGSWKARQTFNFCFAFVCFHLVLIVFFFIFVFVFVYNNNNNNNNNSSSNGEYWTVLELLCATSIITTIEGGSQASVRIAKLKMRFEAFGIDKYLIVGVKAESSTTQHRSGFKAQK